ncbi:hypothetical protein [Azospirillum aestuarii]|uniref:hypothetical protein n=1 Tax=Azospirillum aestuarii TaxID=2802052 RepID=UPI001FFE4010|nr:hypothetical protein [Azospirillum aestuarii]
MPLGVHLLFHLNPVGRQKARFLLRILRRHQGLFEALVQFCDALNQKFALGQFAFGIARIVPRADGCRLAQAPSLAGSE